MLRVAAFAALAGLLRTLALPFVTGRAMSEFTVLVSLDDPSDVVLTGEIDLTTAQQIDAAFARVSGDVNVDCTGVEFIDSGGFHALDRGYKAAVARGSSFAASGMKPFQMRIARLLEVPYCSGREFPDAA